MTDGASRLKQLIAVAKDGSSEKRGDFLREITDVFMTTPDRFTASELQHFDVIMSRVAGQVETTLRRELAERLADVPNAPPTLMRQLAHDEITVAEPVLKRCEALSEDDLVSVILQGGQDHMRAVANRRNVPEKLTAELAARGDESVLARLAENRRAKFSDASMEKMVAHARAMQTLQKPMIDRFDLPPHLLTKMYFFVSPALKNNILNRSDRLDPALVDQAVKANRRKILLGAARDTKSGIADARRFIQKRAAVGEINERLLNDLIATKRQIEFLLAFSHLVGVDMTTAQTLLKDRTWQSQAIACRAEALKHATFVSIVAGLQNDAAYNNATSMLDLYLRIPQDAAERIMRFWRVRPQSAATVTANETRASGRRPKLHEIGQRIAG